MAGLAGLANTAGLAVHANQSDLSSRAAREDELKKKIALAQIERLVREKPEALSEFTKQTQPQAAQRTQQQATGGGGGINLSVPDIRTNTLESMYSPMASATDVVNRRAMDNAAQDRMDQKDKERFDEKIRRQGIMQQQEDQAHQARHSPNWDSATGTYKATPEESYAQAIELKRAGVSQKAPTDMRKTYLDESTQLQAEARKTREGNTLTGVKGDPARADAMEKRAAELYAKALESQQQPQTAAAQAVPQATGSGSVPWTQTTPAEYDPEGYAGAYTNYPEFMPQQATAPATTTPSSVPSWQTQTSPVFPSKISADPVVLPQETATSSTPTTTSRPPAQVNGRPIIQDATGSWWMQNGDGTQTRVTGW